MKQIDAAKLKTDYLSVLASVKETGESVVIYLEDEAVAEIHPVTNLLNNHPLHSLRGQAKIVGDIIAPPLPAEAWDAERGKL